MKILVIRFSSMGDIIYTTPVVRCLKMQLPDAEVHFLTKPDFKYIYDHNPFVDKLLLLKPTLAETIKDIVAENYDHIVDLHNNLRTAIIKVRTGIKASTYKKQTIRKWLSLKFNLRLVPPVHLVDRYMAAVKCLGVVNDGGPINYYFDDNHTIEQLLPASHQKKYIVFIIGATHFTKRLPNEKIISICRTLHYPIVLLGGKDVQVNGKFIAEQLGDNVYNACGVTSLNASVFLVSKAESLIGFDTGLTHIAEAFDKPIVSVWGGTVPDLLGVQPYQVSKVLVTGVELPCRPCSKFGLAKCPQGHFRCMWDINEKEITDFVNQ